MKELIGTAALIMSLLETGNWALREVHNAVRKAALEKVAQGLPRLTELTSAAKRHTR